MRDNKRINEKLTEKRNYIGYISMVCHSKNMVNEF